MKFLRKNQIIKFFRSQTGKITVVLFFLAAIKYFYHLSNSMFDADQEYFALSGQAILSGDFALIGQSTSVGGLFHAPLFNYLVAFFLWIFHGNPLVINGIGAFFATLTIPAFYLIGQKITNPTAALFAAIIALISDSFLGVGSFWITNIFPIPLLVLFFIWIISSNIPKTKKSLLLGLIVGLTFHFHLPIGAVLIPLLFTTGWAWLATFTFLVSPLIFFEIRNNFFITKNALNLLQTNPIGGTSISYRFDTYLVSLADLINFTDHISLYKIVTAVIIIIGLKNKKINQQLKIVLLLPLAFFLLYSRHLVPYYAIVAWTPFILICGVLLSKLYFKNKSLRLLTFLLLSFLAVTDFKHFLNWNPPRSIRYKIAALKFIKNHAGSQTIHISRTIEKPINFGFDYLIPYEGLHPTGNINDTTYTLVVPYNWQNIQTDVHFGDIGVVLPQQQNSMD